MLYFKCSSLGWAGRVLLVVGLGSGAGAARAQEAAPATIRLQPEDLERGLNGQQRNFYFLPPGASGEQYQNAGFFGQKLRPYLAGNPEAVDNLNDYRRQKTLFLLERVVFVSAVALYGQQVLAADNKQQYFNSTQQVAIGVVATSLVANIFINRNTNRHLQHAVDAYNADVDGKGRGSLWHRARPANLALNCTRTGRPLFTLRWCLR